VRFSAILLNAPDFGLDAQTISGTVEGGGGPPYTVQILVKAPGQSDGEAASYSQNVEPDGTFALTPAETYPYLGCDKEGLWESWFVVTDRVGGTATSYRISWAVNFPRAHGIP
jgi:hypothetical protein